MWRMLCVLFLILVKSIYSTVNSSQPLVYWVNLDASTERKTHMEKMFKRWGLTNVRTRGYVPSDIEIGSHLLNYTYCEIQNVDELYKPRYGYQGPILYPHVRVVELCGRKRNLLKDLAGTVGHLMSIHRAVYSNDFSPYALIMEDDVDIGFKIDFNKLGDSAPANWTILQLITSNHNRVSQLWDDYKKKRGLWIKRRCAHGPHHMDFWCAGTYVIHKARIKPYIDKIFHVHPNGTIDLRIIAAYHRPCYPIGCCHEHNWLPPKHPPCTYCPRGFGADDFIYALGTTYTLRSTLIGGASVGNLSTIHQYEVKKHVTAFQMIERNMWEMRNGKAPLPPFATIS